MSRSEENAKRWQFGMRSLLLSIVSAAAIAILIGPFVRSFFSALKENVAAAPEINEPLTTSELESMPLPTKELWSLMNEGKLLGRKAADVEDLFDKATKVDRLNNGQTLYEFDVGDPTISEGRVPFIVLLVGRNGLILRCGTGAVLLPN